MTLIQNIAINFYLIRAESNWIEDILSAIGDAIADALSAVWEAISDVIWTLFFEAIYNAFFKAIETAISAMSGVPEKLFSIPVVIGLLEFFKQIGWGLFIAGFMIAISEICIEYQSMHRLNIKRQIMPLLLGLLAVNLFTTLPVELFKFAVSQQSALTNMIIKLYPTAGGDWSAAQQSALNALKIAVSGGMGVIIYGVAILVIFIYVIAKVFFANLKRGGMLLTMIAVGTLYMVSIPRGYTDGFWSWCKQIVALCVTAVLQNVLLFLGCVITATGGSDFLMVGLGVMLAANEVPRIAQQFGLDTSAKANIGQVAYTAGSTISVAKSVANFASKTV